jgi:hypothetical protein
VQYIEISNASNQQKTAEDNSCGRVNKNIQIPHIKYIEKNNVCQPVPAVLNYRRLKIAGIIIYLTVMTDREVNSE